jgi:hypothetical protein
MAVMRPPWSLGSHPAFPPRFRRAVRVLLLCVHRARRQAASSEGKQQTGGQPGHMSRSSGANETACGAGGPACLADVPGSALLHIASLAPYPLSAWL